MGDLSAHFNRSEFLCKCGNCTMYAVDHSLVEELEKVRTHYGEPITITSGNRCVAHNKAEGGAMYSKHLLSLAADFIVKNIPAKEVYKLLDAWHPYRYGVILYPTWVHFDVRSTKYRDVKV